MSGDTGTDFQNKREYARLEIQIPIEIGMIPADGRNSLRGGPGKNEPIPLPVPQAVEDPLLSDWLK